MKLCRREQNNLFWPSKYNIKKSRAVPWQHWKSMQRYSEYWKLLRNKQLRKRTYLLSEKQFSKIVKLKAAKYSKNNWISHDVALYQFLERRVDVLVYRAGMAKTIMQARQMVNHSHFLVNWVKHNIPSTVLEIGDVVEVRNWLHSSVLYSDSRSDNKIKIPSYISVNKKSFSFELLDMPQASEELASSGDLLKVIEFYARV